MTDIIKFIVFSLARSGTSFLTTSLRSHNDILCHGEALLPRHFEKHVFGPARTALSQKMVEDDPVGFVENLWTHSDGHQAIGFKVFRGHSPDAHPTLLADNSITKIVLQRENCLASFSSGQIARVSGKWGSKRPTDTERKETVPFHSDQFDKYRQRTEAYYHNILTTAQGPLIRITYRDNILNQNLAPVVGFLGLDNSIEMTSTKAKQLTHKITERFDEPDAVLAHLKKIGRLDWAEE